MFYALSGAATPAIPSANPIRTSYAPRILLPCGIALQVNRHTLQSLGWPIRSNSCAPVVSREWSTSVPLWPFPSRGIGCGLRQYRRCNLTERLIGQWKQVVIQVDIDKNTSKLLVLCHVVKHIHPEEVNSLNEAQYLLTHTVSIQGTLTRLVKGEKFGSSY